MLPTAGLPFLTHMLSRISELGVEHVVLGTAYKAEVFEAEFGDGSKLGLQMDYVVEPEPLGTGGGIANVASKLRHDTALVFNGDVLAGANLRSLLETHENTGADVTLTITATCLQPRTGSRCPVPARCRPAPRCGSGPCLPR